MPTWSRSWKLVPEDIRFLIDVESNPLDRVVKFRYHQYFVGVPTGRDHQNGAGRLPSFQGSLGPSAKKSPAPPTFNRISHLITRTSCSKHQRVSHHHQPSPALHSRPHASSFLLLLLLLLLPPVIKRQSSFDAAAKLRTSSSSTSPAHRLG